MSDIRIRIQTYIDRIIDQLNALLQKSKKLNASELADHKNLLNLDWIILNDTILSKKHNQDIIPVFKKAYHDIYGQPTDLSAAIVQLKQIIKMIKK